ncbi:glutamate synthase [Lysobacteraceae bacterium NML07-0707]|nr:glutamate synthase [Xanthomonadaceae bacterium NML07-0707]
MIHLIKIFLIQGVAMKSWAGWLLLPVLAGCQVEKTTTAEAMQNVEPSPEQVDEAARQRAQQAAKAFSERLQSALKQKMGAEGPVAAIDFCKTQAPVIAAAVADEQGVAIGRIPVAGKVRNRANAIEGWQAEVLADFQARAASTPVSELVYSNTEQLPEGIALRMMKAIEVQPACLACHGKQLAEPVRQALARNYPEDTATGFEAGDLRGALWVEVPSNPVVSN